MIFAARKRSLGQGNIFIGVCQEFCSQGGGGSASGGGGVCLQGGCLLPGGVPGAEGVPGPGGADACPGGGPGGDPLDGYCCGRYASYWNTFLSGLMLWVQFDLDLLSFKSVLTDFHLECYNLPDSQTKNLKASLDPSPRHSSFKLKSSTSCWSS